MNITGLNKVNAMLERKKLIGQRVVVLVGFTAAYAINVHEDLQAHHDVGQAKFLEQPARELGNVIRGDVATNMKRGATLEQGLIVGGLRLQREAQKLVPVDTGALKGSAFTRKEE